MKVKYDGISFFAFSCEEKGKISRPVSDRLAKSWKHRDIYEEGKDFVLINSSVGSYFGHPEEYKYPTLLESMHSHKYMIDFANYCSRVWGLKISNTEELYEVFSKSRLPTSLPKI